MPSSKITQISGSGIPVTGNDIDTDRIIPARFLKCVTFEDLGQYAFYDVRYDEKGQKKEHSFNDSKYEGASVLVVNRNFGCGSSREHAPQSILRSGIKAIIGESFAEIFADNCTSIGMPAVTASKTDIDQLIEWIQKNPKSNIEINLDKKEVVYDKHKLAISIPEQSRKALVTGLWDSTGELLENIKSIEKVRNQLPYVNHYR